MALGRWANRHSPVRRALTLPSALLKAAQRGKSRWYPSRLTEAGCDTTMAEIMLATARSELVSYERELGT
jgi:hypothetical protein